MLQMLQRSLSLCSGLILIGSLLLITACGGGSSGDSASNETPAPETTPEPEPTPEPETTPEPEPTTVAGKVIDGYVSGATVWLDINGNKQLDEDEPSALSGTAGDYSLALTDEQRDCLAYATLFVDVPVGAIDEDPDIGVVTEAYQMAIPPLFEPISDDDLLNISPLTTVLWQQIENKITTDNQEQEQSCEALRENDALRTELAEEIADVIGGLVFHYNISAEDIYADFIATNDEAAQQAARAIVTGLQAAYAHKTQLELDNPDGVQVQVLIYQSTDQDADAFPAGTWVRNSSIFNPDPDSSLIQEAVLDSDDLSSVAQITFEKRESAIDWNGGRLTIRQDRSPIEGADQHRCFSSERVGFTVTGADIGDAGIGRYGLTINYDTTAQSSATCSSDIGSETASISAKNYIVGYGEPGEPDVGYLADFTIVPDTPEFAALEHWQALEGNESNFDPEELMTYLETLPYRFDQDVTIGGPWYKRIEDGSGENEVVTTQSGEGASGEVRWERVTFQSDNTRIKECGTDGETWTTCP